jgi:hypothetical protein
MTVIGSANNHYPHNHYLLRASQAPGIATRQWIDGIFWQPFPVYAAVVQRVLDKFVKHTTHHDRIENAESDMPYLRRAYGFFIATAASAYILAHFASPVSLINEFSQGLATL